MRLRVWPDLRLRTKGLIVIAVPATATVLIACASYALGARAREAQNGVIQNLEASQQIQRLRANVAEASAQARAYFITGQEAFVSQWREATNAFDASLARLLDLTKGDVFQSQRAAELTALERWRLEQISGETARFRSGGLPPEALRAAIRATEANREAMGSVLRAMEARQSRLLEFQSRDVNRLQKELRDTTVICLFLGVVGGVGISLLFASGITNRVGQLQANVSKLATCGVLEPLPGGRDEIGILSEGVARTVEVLRQRTAGLENALHGIAQICKRGCYLSFNKAYAEIANLSDADLGASLLDRLEPDDQVQVSAAIDRMRSVGRAEVETHLVTRSGVKIDVAMTFLPFSTDPSAGYYVFLQDISKRKETEAELVRAKDAALASSLAKNDFLAKISHDIRTPLNAILGGAHLLSETPLNTDQKEYVNLFQRNSARLVTLINDFLDFSRIEAGALKLERIPFRIRGTVEDAVATFRESAARKGIGLEVEISEDVPDCGLGDPLRVQQVLVNLLSNAIKFTDEGRVSVAVLKQPSTAGDRLSFEVSDTGPGISAEDRERVFAAFTQLSKQPPPGVKGVGLGLTICRELVERMGGEIGVSGQPGEGSKFYFSFPLEVAQALDAGEDDTAGAGRPRPAGDVKIRVLVAEDGEDNRLLLSHYLRNEQVSVKFATDGQKALDLIRAGSHFDLILMDLDMPVLDGYQATKLILEWQKAQREASTPIVALSAHAMRDAQHASLAAGCVAHVSKPVDKITLLRTIHRYSRGSSARHSEVIEVAEGVEALVPKYLASKAKQIEEAQAALAVKDFDPIWRFGHNLKGTGRGYGFPPIEEMGKAIEKAAASQDEESIALQLQHLHKFVTEDCGMTVQPGLRKT